MRMRMRTMTAMTNAAMAMVRVVMERLQEMDEDDWGKLPTPRHLHARVAAGVASLLR
jgi:hypothetical protein